MAKYKRDDFLSAIDRINSLPKERREKIEAGAMRILTNALEFEERFDAGEDLGDLVDWSTARRPNSDTRP